MLNSRADPPCASLASPLHFRSALNVNCLLVLRLQAFFKKWQVDVPWHSWEFSDEALWGVVQLKESCGHTDPGSCQALQPHKPCDLGQVISPPPASVSLSIKVKDKSLLTGQLVV